MFLTKSCHNLKRTLAAFFLFILLSPTITPIAEARRGAGDPRGQDTTPDSWNGGDGSISPGTGGGASGNGGDTGGASGNGGDNGNGGGNTGGASGNGGDNGNGGGNTGGNGNTGGSAPVNPQNPYDNFTPEEASKVVLSDTGVDYTQGAADALERAVPGMSAVSAIADITRALADAESYWDTAANFAQNIDYDDVAIGTSNVTNPSGPITPEERADLISRINDPTYDEYRAAQEIAAKSADAVSAAIDGMDKAINEVGTAEAKVEIEALRDEALATGGLAQVLNLVAEVEEYNAPIQTFKNVAYFDVSIKQSLDLVEKGLTLGANPDITASLYQDIQELSNTQDDIIAGNLSEEEINAVAENHTGEFSVRQAAIADYLNTIEQTPASGDRLGPDAGSDINSTFDSVTENYGYGGDWDTFLSDLEQKNQQAYNNYLNASDKLNVDPDNKDLQRLSLEAATIFSDTKASYIDALEYLGGEYTSPTRVERVSVTVETTSPPQNQWNIVETDIPSSLFDPYSIVDNKTLVMTEINSGLDLKVDISTLNDGSSMVSVPAKEVEVVDVVNLSNVYNTDEMTFNFDENVEINDPDVFSDINERIVSLSGGQQYGATYSGPKGVASSGLSPAAEKAAVVSASFQVPSVPYTQAELDFATAVVMAESAAIINELGQLDTENLLSVAETIRNRVLSDDFEDTINDVLTAKSQFTPVTNGSYKYFLDDSRFDSVKDLVESVLDGTSVPVNVTTVKKGNVNFGNVEYIESAPNASKKTKADFKSLRADPNSVTIASAQNPINQHTFGTLYNAEIPDFTPQTTDLFATAPTVTTQTPSVSPTTPTAASTPVADNTPTNPVARALDGARKFVGNLFGGNQTQTQTSPAADATLKKINDELNEAVNKGDLTLEKAAELRNEAQTAWLSNNVLDLANIETKVQSTVEQTAGAKTAAEKALVDTSKAYDEAKAILDQMQPNHPGLASQQQTVAELNDKLDAANKTYSDLTQSPTPTASDTAAPDNTSQKNPVAGLLDGIQKGAQNLFNGVFGNNSAQQTADSTLAAINKKLEADVAAGNITTEQAAELRNKAQTAWLAGNTPELQNVQKEVGAETTPVATAPQTTPTQTPTKIPNPLSGLFGLFSRNKTPETQAPQTTQQTVTSDKAGATLKAINATLETASDAKAAAEIFTQAVNIWAAFDEARFAGDTDRAAAELEKLTKSFEQAKTLAGADTSVTIEDVPLNSNTPTPTAKPAENTTITDTVDITDDDRAFRTGLSNSQYEYLTTAQVDVIEASEQIEEVKEKLATDPDNRLAQAALDKSEEALSIANLNLDVIENSIRNGDLAQVAASSAYARENSYVSSRMSEIAQAGNFDGANIDPKTDLEVAQDVLWGAYKKSTASWTFKDTLAAAYKYDKLASNVTWSQIQSLVARGQINNSNVKNYLSNEFSQEDLKNYVVGGIDPDFAVQAAAAGVAMEEQGLNFVINSAFRDDARQSLINSGTRANVGHSHHGGSVSTGGYGNGKAIDINGTREQSWIDTNGREYGVTRPYDSPGSTAGIDDAPHVGPVTGGEASRRGLGLKQSESIETISSNATEALDLQRDAVSLADIENRLKDSFQFEPDEAAAVAASSIPYDSPQKEIAEVKAREAISLMDQARQLETDPAEFEDVDSETDTPNNLTEVKNLKEQAQKVAEEVQSLSEDAQKAAGQSTSQATQSQTKSPTTFTGALRAEVERRIKTDKGRIQTVGGIAAGLIAGPFGAIAAAVGLSFLPDDLKLEGLDEPIPLSPTASSSAQRINNINTDSLVASAIQSATSPTLNTAASLQSILGDELAAQTNINLTESFVGTITGPLGVMSSRWILGYSDYDNVSANTQPYRAETIFNFLTGTSTDKYIPVYIEYERSTGAITMNRDLLQYENQHVIDNYGLSSSSDTPIVFNDEGQVIFSDGTFAPVTVNGEQLDSETKYIYLTEGTENGLPLAGKSNADVLPGNLITQTVSRWFTNTDPFFAEDIVDITSNLFDPDINAANDEYKIYSITLNDGSQRSVAVPDKTTLGFVQNEFIKAGYTGDILDALARTNEGESFVGTTGDSNIFTKLTGFLRGIFGSDTEEGTENTSLFTNFGDTENSGASLSKNLIDRVDIYFNIPNVNCPNVTGLDDGYVYRAQLNNGTVIAYPRCGSGNVYEYADAVAYHLFSIENFDDIGGADVLDKLTFNFYYPNSGISIDSLIEDIENTQSVSETVATTELPTNTNLIVFEVQARNQDGTVTQSWTTEDIAIDDGDQIDFRWNASSEYEQCLLFLADNGQYRFSRLGDFGLTSGNTETEGFDVFERSGDYRIECNQDTTNEQNVDARTIEVIVLN